MAITQKFLKGFDHPEWRPKAPGASLGNSTTSIDQGTHLMSDLRGRDYSNPNVWAFSGTSPFFKYYNTLTDGWLNVSTTLRFGSALTGTLTGNGLTPIFAPSKGPSGTISAGTTTTVTLSTVLPVAPLANEYANRGDGQGHIIRIIGNSGGGSGKIEERRIIANTASTTSVITVNEPFTFTPQAGDGYEILSGRIYTLTTGASKNFKWYDIALHGFSGNLSTTSLIGTVPASANQMVYTDEAYVPYTRFPGEGYLVGAGVYDNTAGWVKGCLTATATSGTTLTGEAAAGDYQVNANQFRNFQIRIVEDTATPTAVGQRRVITSHTAGASPVYTVPTWTVTPSATAKYVIENNGDWIFYWANSNTTTYTYTISTDTWSTATFAARATGPQLMGFEHQAFGVDPTDPVAKGRNSRIYLMRNTGVYDVLDIAGAATGTWTNGVTVPINDTTLYSTTSYYGCAYNPYTNKGRYLYRSGNSSSLSFIPFMQFDMLTDTFQPFTTLKYPSGATTVYNNRLTLSAQYTQGVYLPFLYTLRPAATSTEFFDCYIPPEYV